jgi:hypothetical protein
MCAASGWPGIKQKMVESPKTLHETFSRDWRWQPLVGPSSGQKKADVKHSKNGGASAEV